MNGTIEALIPIIGIAIGASVVYATYLTLGISEPWWDLFIHILGY